MLVLFLVAFVVFFAVLCVNAAKCKPVVSNTQVKDVKLDIDAEEKAKRGESQPEKARGEGDPVRSANR